MEGDKEAYLEEATKALRRQRKTLEDLEAEREELRQCHKTAASKRNSKKDGENAAKVARLAEEQVQIHLILYLFRPTYHIVFPGNLDQCHEI